MKTILPKIWVMCNHVVIVLIVSIFALIARALLLLVSLFKHGVWILIGAVIISLLVHFEILILAVFHGIDYHVVAIRPFLEVSISKRLIKLLSFR